MKNQFTILLISLILFSCKSKVENEEEKKTFVLSDKMLSSTKTEKVSLQPLKNELSFYGKITSDNNKTVEIFPVVGGSVTQVFVELGDYVEKGKILASIRSTEVAGFEKDLDDAKNDVVIAKNSLKVAQELYEGKLSSEQDLLEAKSRLEKAQSQLNRVLETYKIYNITKEATFEVRSPMNGFIVQKNITQDMLLRNDRSDNIFDIADIDEVWAIANINESDINQVKLGIDAAVTTLSYPNKVFNGKVDKIFNIIDPETKAMKVRIKLVNSDYLLKPEMRANIKLSYEEPGVKMLVIPSTAVIFDKSRNYVMIFKDRNNIETRRIEVYRQVEKSTYVSFGLKENEQVITQNQLLIYDALND